MVVLKMNRTHNSHGNTMVATGEHVHITAYINLYTCTCIILIKMNNIIWTTSLVHSKFKIPVVSLVNEMK